MAGKKETAVKKKEKRTAGTDLLNGSVAKTLLLFSFPLMLSTLLQTFYSTVDTVVVGQYLGSAGLSAVSNGSQLIQMMTMITIGFSTAGQVLISQAEGAEEHEMTGKVATTLMQLVFLLAVIEGVICVAGAGWLLNLLETPEEAYEQARLYVMICGVGMIPIGFYNMFSAIFRGMGDSNHPLIFVAIASILNMILDVVFIGGFGWNVAGAALATVIGQILSVVFSIQLLVRHKDTFHIELKNVIHASEFSTVRSIVRLGIPLAIQSTALQISFLFVSRLINGEGLAESAAFGVTQKLRNIPAVITQGLSLGSSSMIGQNWGAKKDDRVSKIVIYGIIYSTICMAAFGIFFALAPELSFRLFTQDETVLALGTMCIFTMLIEFPARCVMTPCNALISAQGFVGLSMAIAFIDAFAGRIFFCYLFGVILDLGAFGMFLGYSLGTYLTAIPVLVYFCSGLWKKRPRLVS